MMRDQPVVAVLASWTLQAVSFAMDRYRPHARAFAVATALVLSAALIRPAHADLADTVARVKPALVVVGSYRSTDSPRFRMRGSGFVVGDGSLAITNFHVLPEASENMANANLVVQVRRSGGDLSMRQATVVQVDKVHDLALLRFEGAPAPVMRIGDSDTAREGQAVAFMGFPIGGALGFSPVTHRAMISSITPAAMPTPTARQLNEATIRSVRAGPFNIFQLDGTAYPGNSGGPLFDPETGDVLGVVNMVFIKGSRESALSQPSGISYAIPSRFVQELLDAARLK